MTIVYTICVDLQMQTPKFVGPNIIPDIITIRSSHIYQDELLRLLIRFTRSYMLYCPTNGVTRRTWIYMEPQQLYKYRDHSE